MSATASNTANNSSSPTRAGVSAKEFKLYTAEAASWLWGTVQGAWNEKQTLSQIIVDAVIGMIPVVGDVTAVRDLIAVGTGLANAPEKREKTSEWVLLVILIFALIPVIGGVIKGVGRIALMVTTEMASNSAAATKLANDVIAFLNRIGHKNAEAWFKSLNVLKYEAELISKFRNFCDTVILAINRYGLRFKGLLPQSFTAKMTQTADAFQQLKALGDKMIPLALKDLHGRLQMLQKLIHAGGVPPPDKAKVIVAQTGQKTVTYAEEARLIETGAAKTTVKAGKHPQNLAATDAQAAKVYKYESGFPDLQKMTDEDKSTGIKYYSAIAAASGPIKNEMLSGETLFRSFGPAGTTHHTPVKRSYPTGMWWGRGEPPATAKEWREKSAVLDEFNRNGWLAIVRIPPDTKIPACTSTVSEQFSKKIPGQFLEGGGRQAVVDFSNEKMIQTVTDTLHKKGGGKETIRLTTGQEIVVEVRQSGWSGINGKIGYGETVIPGAAVTERLGITERQTKMATQSAQAGAKHNRNE